MKWKPSIFLPKDACRLFIKIKSIKVERLRDIKEEDVKAEGVLLIETNKWTRYTHLFEELWNKINGKKYPWSSNPFVWVIEFEQTKKPGNFL